MKSPPPESDEEEPKFDAHKFRNSKFAKFYNKVIKCKHIAKFRVFDYALLSDDGLELFTDFMFRGIYRFHGFHCDF